MEVVPSPKSQDQELIGPGELVEPSKKKTSGQLPKVYWKNAEQVGGIIQLIVSVSQKVLVQALGVPMVRHTT